MAGIAVTEVMESVGGYRSLVTSLGADSLCDRVLIV